VIVYSLHCPKGHEFEGWFKDSSAFDAQSKSGKLLCPVCNSKKIEKAPMAPALAGSVGERNLPVEPPKSAADELRKARQFMTGLRKFVEDNAEYVGPKFPEEARKIHYGESEERHIYGEASLEDARELIEEGVEVAPLPPDLSEAN
jgi:hypothetical protein